MDASSATGAVHRPGRGRVFDSIVDAVGDTPIVRLRKLPQAHGVNATILAKLEYFSPAASVKDRIGAAMVIAMEKAGVINADTVLIEPTSGNTGIALAFVAASRGYRLKPVLPGGQHTPHKIQGIGAGFIPDILDRSVIDEIVRINSSTAIETARALARNEGIPGGISSGAAIAAAIEIGKRPESAGKTILAIVPSFSERYLSTALFEGI